MLASRHLLQGRRGVTLVELMVASAVLGTAILIGTKSFYSIQASIQVSKGRTLATNLSQEKIQILKQRAYSRLMVSTATAYRTEFSPNIPYDVGYYPPESISEGGIRFTRMTHVEVAQEDSGNILTLPATTPDTGMKLITVTTIWQHENDLQKLQVRAVYSNPNTVMSISILRGTVRNANTLQVIPNAVVNIAENAGWRDTTNNLGAYIINLSPGDYNVFASADGYFTRTISMSISPNSSPSQTFDLTPMSTGTIRGRVWYNDHLVISQVVGSTRNASGYYQEYVELYNPTTSYVALVSAGSRLIDLIYQQHGGSAVPITLDFGSINVSMAPNSYFLIANTETVRAANVVRTADATYSTSNSDYPNIIKINSDSGGDVGAGIGLAWSSNAGSLAGTWIDRVGWQSAGTDPPIVEGSPIQQAIGLQDNEQYVRYSSTSGVNTTNGRAYDSGNNAVDFYGGSPLNVNYPPRNSSDIQTPIAGVPAIGAYITATDDLSAPTTAYATGNPVFAEFILPRVSTGVWNVFVTSGNRILEISTVTLTANTTTWVPNATTVPPSTTPSCFLSSAATTGFVSGKVTNVLGNPITSPSVISVSARGGGTASAGNTGNYFLRLAPGNYTITANPGNANSSYVSKDQTVSVDLGEVTNDVDFRLSQGGRVTGFVTRDGINALAGVSVAALNISSSTVDQEVSGTNGYFTLMNLTTGTYRIQPMLEAAEASNPTSVSVSVTAGATVSAGTFTITGAYGTVTGTVKKSGQPIPTGVLIIVSTTSVSGIPPALSSMTLTGVPYYMGASLEDGTYSVDVRGSSTTVYRVHAFYTTFNGQTPSISTGAVANITITAGQTRTGVNFSW